MCARVLILVLLASPLALHGAKVEERGSANPMRKVVTMLQMMQNKIEAEGKAEEKLFDAFMCYCKGGEEQLNAGIEAGKKKITDLESSIAEQSAEHEQLNADLTKAKDDRTAGKAAMAQATGIREKEAAAFDQTSTDLKTNLAALGKAIAAISKGQGGSFLQTGAAQTVKNFVMVNGDIADVDRQDLLSFLSNTDAAPSSEVLGIMKTLEDEMNASLSDAEKAEAAAITTFDELIAAKTKEVESLTAQIEEKSVRVGEVGVAVAQQKNDLEDTQEQVEEDTKFVADLDTMCAAKQAEWDERCKLRSEELLALADVVKMLNGDEAQELFKKTLPGAGSSFVQIQVTTAAMKSRALALINKARNTPHGQNLDFIALALRGKTGGFEKVIKMIDDMTATLKQEQKDDEAKKAYCEKEFDTSEDKKKELANALDDLETAIADSEEGIATLKTEIEALEDGIKALDKSVTEATEQRKEENEEYQGLMASNSACKELIGMAKNRMNKFYNPKLYKAPPKRELTEEERITLNMGGTLAPTAAPGGIAGTGVAVFVQVRTHTQAAQPAPPPAAEFGGSKGEESGGVIAMLDMMVADLDKEMTVAEAEEKDGQGDYEKMMKDSAEKRAEDSKTMTDKESAKAEMEGALEQHNSDKAATTTELAENAQYIGGLHGECDWLLQNFDARKEARTGEIDAMGKAKDVLNGADYSLLQMAEPTRVTRKFLRNA